VALGLLLAGWTLRLAVSDSPWCFLDYANLAFHEAGHLVFHPFGSTLGYLGGTLCQCLVPITLGAWFLLRERKVLGMLVCVWWLGENLVNVARYMADARDLALPLVGGGDHDWNELFYRFGLLGESSVATISGVTRGVGLALMVLGLCGIVVVTWPRRRHGAAPPPPRGIRGPSRATQTRHPP